MEPSTTKSAVVPSLEQAAIAAELDGGDSIAWETTWRALKAGELRVLRSFTTPDRYYLVLSARPFPTSRAASDEVSAMLTERWLAGTPQKVLAIEAGLKPSSICQLLQRGLLRLGLACRPTQVPVVMGMLVSAGTGRPPLDPGRMARFEHGSRECVVLGVARPEPHLSRYVSPAEYVALRMLAEGSSYAQIAGARRVASRTVANQIASGFRRLGVSGRLELQQLLLRFAAGQAKVSSPVTVGDRSRGVTVASS
jgi:DNA-binding CsgD family transcriptional regulator